MANDNSDTKHNHIASFTLKMLRKFTLNTEEITSKSTLEIELIAKVSEMREISQKYEFCLYDFSGKLTAVAYRNANKLKPGCFKDYTLIENGYVHIFGSIRKGEDTAFVIKCIENVNEKKIVNEFYSRIILDYLKNKNKETFTLLNKEDLIHSAIEKARYCNQGFTVSEIMAFLNHEISQNELEETLSEMVLNGKLKNGIDWNHYKLT